MSRSLEGKTAFWFFIIHFHVFLVPKIIPRNLVEKFPALLYQSNQIISWKHKINITCLQCSSTEVKKKHYCLDKNKSIIFETREGVLIIPFTLSTWFWKKEVQRAKSICSETKALRCIFKTRCKFPRTVRFSFNVFLGSLRGLVKF